MRRWTAVDITGFGALRGRRFTLGPGLTLVTGVNEAGKSTLLQAIAQVLLGKPSQRRAFHEYTPRDGGPFAAALECEEAGVRYRLTRRFGESGPRAIALSRCDATGDCLITQEASAVRTWVAAALGTADDRLFHRVFCLSPADFTPLDNYGGLLEQLERAASGAEVAVTAAVQRVETHLAAVRRGHGQPALPQNWGPLKRAEEARREWECRLQEVTRAQRRLQELRAETGALEDELTAVVARIDVLRGTLEQARTRRAQETRLGELRTLWQDRAQARERVTQLAAEQARHQQTLAALPAALAHPEDLRRRMAAARAAGSPSPLPGWACIAGGVLLAVAAFLAARQPAAWLLAVPGLAIGLPLLLRAARARRATTDLCTSLGLRSLHDTEHRLAEAEELRRRLDATTLALEALGTPTSEEPGQDLALEIAKLEAQLHTIPGAPLTAEESYRLTAELQAREEALPALRTRERALTRELAVLEAGERDLTEIEDGVAFWRQQEARAREEEATLELAKALLLEAGARAHTSLTVPLSARIVPLFATMTQGRYPRVDVQADAERFQVMPLDADGQSHEIATLSTGTRDQLLLAVRLALGQTLAGSQGSPLFLLDDPLVHFDAARRAEALAMLRTLASTTQMILATHDASLITAFPEATVIRMDLT